MKNILDDIGILEKRRQKILVERDKLNLELKFIDMDIAKHKEQALRTKKEGLVVSEHAIQRFNERIIELPRQRVKNILSSNELKVKYLKHGNNRFKVKEAPGCIAVIKGGCVVTVLSSFDHEYQLEVLRKYMDYYIDYLAKKHNGEECFIPKYKDYKKKYSI